jgi:hypothetical protein
MIDVGRKRRLQAIILGTNVLNKSEVFSKQNRAFLELTVDLAVTIAPQGHLPLHWQWIYLRIHMI